MGRKLRWPSSVVLVRRVEWKNSETLGGKAVKPATEPDSAADAGLKMTGVAARESPLDLQRRPSGGRIVTGRGLRPKPSALGLADAGISPVWAGALDGAGAAAPGYRTSQTRDATFRRTLALADIISAYASLLIATRLIGSGSLRLQPCAALIAPLIVVACKAIGLYDRDQHILRKTTLDELPSILHISVFYALAVWLTQSVVLTGSLGRPEVFSLVTSCFVFMTLGRATARFTALRLCSEERCIVLGGAVDAQRAAGKLSGSPGVKATVVGRITVGPREHRDIASVGILGDVSSLVGVIAEQRADRVIVAPDGHDEDEILDVIRTLKALGVKVSVLPRLLEVVGSSSTFDEIDGITLLGVRQAGLTNSSRFLKRAMDICVAAVALTLLSPLLLLIAALVVLDSRGPVLFRQTRIGRGGQRFSMYKFRSMVSNAESVKDDLQQRNEAEGGLFKITNDPRITRVGRILRPAALDELAQLFNVLFGHMSLVGPRPLVPDEDALIEGWERRRLVVRPGMTGLWQIFGSSRIPLPEMVKIDYFYCANWSLWVDMKIMLRTIPYIVRRRGM